MPGRAHREELPQETFEPFPIPPYASTVVAHGPRFIESRKLLLKNVMLPRENCCMKNPFQTRHIRAPTPPAPPPPPAFFMGSIQPVSLSAPKKDRRETQRVPPSIPERRSPLRFRRVLYRESLQFRRETSRVSSECPPLECCECCERSMRRVSVSTGLETSGWLPHCSRGGGGGGGGE